MLRCQRKCTGSRLYQQVKKKDQRVICRDGLTNSIYRAKKSGSPLRLFSEIFRNIWNLPKPIQRICNVQFFAWIGWFPFLFYSTTWVAEIYNKTLLDDDNSIEDKLGQATRAGSFAFLVYSVVSLSSSFLIPILVTPSDTNSYDKETTSKVITLQIFGKKREYRLSCLSYLKLSFLTLPRAWTISHFIFCICMLSTMFVSDVTAAAIIIGLCGISWAISMWAPFSLLGEYISKQEAIAHKIGEHESTTTENYANEGFVYHSHLMASRASLALGMTGEPAIYQPVSTSIEEEDIEMLGVKKAHQLEDNNGGEGSGSNGGSDNNEDEEQQRQHTTQSAPAAGVLLGIHNMYIVLPQFLVTFFSSIIFRLLDTSDHLNETPRDSIGLILRIGAVMAGVAGFISMKIGKD